jgi:hypothetical protein
LQNQYLRPKTSIQLSVQTVLVRVLPFLCHCSLSPSIRTHDALDTADSSLLLSTNKAGIKIKFHSPTPSPSKYPVSTLVDFDGSGSFRPECTSSPSAPRELKIATGFDDGSFACAHKGFLPASSSWLGCHLVTEFKTTNERKPAKQEGKGEYMSVARVVLEKNLRVFYIFSP